MDSSKGPCPHQGLPVETDESLTSFGLDEAWPPGSCKQCSGPPERPHDEKAEGAAPDVGQWRLTESQYHPELRGAAHDAPRRGFMPSNHAGPMNPAPPADDWPHGFRYNMMPCDLDLRSSPGRGFGSSSHHPQDRSMEDSERLERPHTLLSDVNCTHCVPDRYHPAPTPGREPIQGALLRQFPCCPQENLYPLNGRYHRNPAHPAGPHLEPQQHRQPDDRMYFRGAPNAPGASDPRFEAPPIDAVHEVSVDRSHPAGPGSGTKEMRRTIHLPEECRNVFITYSMDTANEIIPFVKFLVDQGFEPAIDMFDNPIRRMSILKWMDRFLNDNSVLIIVVISPKYKEDVEGDGDDEHGLHTKYIHNQIQNEFIQQRCRNFRLVPVMFPNATKKHVPNWLQSTRIYRWPQDTQDLLLRLFREERYIIPQRGGDLTLTVRPL